jgi:hypothetical protein
MSTYTIIKKVETSATEIAMCSDGIMRVMYKKNREIDSSVLKNLIENYNQLVEGKKHPYIYYTEDNSVTFSHDVREYFKQHEQSFPKICDALVVKSLAQKLIANFYLKFNKPAYPTKVFNTMEDAETWCLQQSQKHKNNKMLSLL